MAKGLIETIFEGSVQLSKSAGPLYVQLQDMIRDAIENHILLSGVSLPAEREIATALKVSRVTVRRAIDDLVKEGLLTQRQGAGTFVTDRVQQPLNYLRSFSEVIAHRGQVAGSSWLDRSLGLATTEEQLVFNIQASDEVVRLYRLRTSDGKPMGLELASIPRTYLDHPFLVKESLYQTLDEQGFRPVRALQKIRAVSIDAKRAQLLNIESQSAVLYIERRGMLSDGTIMEFTRCYFPGDSYDFTVEINGLGRK